MPNFVNFLGFRKLTLQSPQQSNIPPKTTEQKTVPPSELAIQKQRIHSVTPTRSQSQVITNKLMLSTSSNALTDTNFINVETEPFSNPLQVESTEHVQKSPKTKSDNGELTSQMEKLEVSRVSAELFSQYSSSSKISLPPNRILSNKENIENLSQRMSNIRMSDVADTQPNTPSGDKRRSHSTIADTQPNTAPHTKNQLERSDVIDDERIVASIVLSSDDEDNNDGGNIPRKSLLTEESDDDSVIEIVSSDDSIVESNDRVPQNSPQKSAINVEIDELTESVAQKLNNFFDNIPRLDSSRQNFFRNVVPNVSSDDNADTSEIDIPETAPSDGKKADEINVLELEASQLEENGNMSGSKDKSQLNSSHENEAPQLDKSDKMSGNKDTSHISVLNENEGDEKNDTRSSLSETPHHDASRHSSLQSSVLHLNESLNEFADDESENRLDENEGDNVDSSKLNQSTDEKQLSVREPKKKIQFEKIKTNAIRLNNSPTINVSATININIQVSGFSSNSSDTDATVTSENTEDPSEKSSKIDASQLSEDVIDSSMELVSHCRKIPNASRFGESERLIVYSPNINKPAEIDLTNQDDQLSPNSSVIESSIILSEGDATSRNRNYPDTFGLHVSAEKQTDNGSLSATSIAAKESNDGSITSGEAKESNDASISSADIATTESMDVSTSSADPVPKEPTNVSSSSADPVTKESAIDDAVQDENTPSVTPTDTSVEIDEIGEQLLNGIYGDTVSLCGSRLPESQSFSVCLFQWRTPQLIKKCVSTKKKYQTDVMKRGPSRGFSMCECDSNRV